MENELGTCEVLFISSKKNWDQAKNIFKGCLRRLGVEEGKMEAGAERVF